MSNEEKEATEEEKGKAAESFMIETSKYAIALMKLLGLKTHMETFIEDQTTGEKYLYSFKKITDGFVGYQGKLDQLSMDNIKFLGRITELENQLYAKDKEMEGLIEIHHAQDDDLAQQHAGLNNRILELEKELDTSEKALQEINRQHQDDYKRLKESETLLRELTNLQNGPPLPTYRKDWTECMEKINEHFFKSENV